MTTTNHHRENRTLRNKHKRLDKFSLVILFVLGVSMALVLIEVARGASPLVLILPTALGCLTILGIER